VVVATWLAAVRQSYIRGNNGIASIAVRIDIELGMGGAEMGGGSAVCRLIANPDTSGRLAGPPARHGGIVGGRRRQAVRRLQPPCLGAGGLGARLSAAPAPLRRAVGHLLRAVSSEPADTIARLMQPLLPAPIMPLAVECADVPGLSRRLARAAGPAQSSVA
jgi:hypothetical protein